MSTKTTAKTETQAKTEATETALTMGEVLWDLAPSSLDWEDTLTWCDHWSGHFSFTPTSFNAGRLVGPTTLYTEAGGRLSKKGYRVRRQSGLGRAWLYISR
jgi:hypothetical protein